MSPTERYLSSLYPHRRKWQFPHRRVGTRAYGEDRDADGLSKHVAEFDHRILLTHLENVLKLLKEFEEVKFAIGSSIGEGASRHLPNEFLVSYQWTRGSSGRRLETIDNRCKGDGAHGMGVQMNLI